MTMFLCFSVILDVFLHFKSFKPQSSMAHQGAQIQPVVHPVQLPQVQVHPLPPAGPQPNFGNLDQHVNGLREELGRFANLPGFTNQQNFQHLNNGLQAVVQGLNHLILAVQANTASVQATYVPIFVCSGFPMDANILSDLAASLCNSATPPHHMKLLYAIQWA
jgi:hypothetical protein